MHDTTAPVRKVTIIKNTEKPVQNYRFYSQVLFSIICIWIGIEFVMFVRQLDAGTLSPNFYRPPGVEGFLPISAFMSVVYFLQSGIIHPVHPAGFIILAGIMLMSFVAGKSFCSWICPVGFISELTGEFGVKLFKNKLHMPKFLDVPLRSLKYLLLGLFAVSITTMSLRELNLFLLSDYNIIADIKLYEFFRFMSPFAFWTLTSLLVLSVLFRNFWCRYLCPYGALLGVIGLFSPAKITRYASTCIDCAKCDKVCPSRIAVSKKKMVISDECTSCMLCVDICPVKDTLDYKIVGTNKFQSKYKIAAAALLVFIFILLTGMLTHNWKNTITGATYQQIYEHKEEVSH